MSYLQVAVTVPRQRAMAMTEWLNDQGALAVTVESAGDDIMFDEAEPGEPEWVSQKLTALFADEIDPALLMSRVNGYSGKQDSTLSRLADQDWERSWLDQFSPVQVNPNLWICPSWIEPPHPGAINLRIDPGLAFGTGTHPTTFLCLEELSRIKLEGALVVDYGCGSGILGIAALALGASAVVATDIDQRALKASRENAEKNRVSTGFHCALPDQLDAMISTIDTATGEAGDVIIANILAGTLINLHDRIKKLGGQHSRLLLSGILDHQADQVQSTYQDEFDFERFARDQWVLLSGVRK